MASIDKIVQTLIINGTLTDSPGLFYGKTGIAVFFFHYARHTGNRLYQNYAMDLIEEVQKQIIDPFSVRYDVGLAGIGVGFAYFLQNGFIETDDSDFFEDFDARMYRTAMYEPYPDFSLEGGLTGWGRYFIYRMRVNGQKNSKLHEALTHIAHEIAKKVTHNAIPENEQPDVYRFLYDLVTLPAYADKYANALEQCREWNCIRKPDIQKIFPCMNNLQRLYACQKYFNMDLTEEIGKERANRKASGTDLLTDMGLLNGWTMEGLSYLTSIEKQETSWINLL